jgi:hypothetical protein
MQLAGIGELSFDPGAPACNHVQHRPVKETLEDPDQDQKVDDLKQKSGPAQFQGIFRFFRFAITANTAQLI